MLGSVIHPQFIDNLAMGLVARFNIKDDVKDVVKFLKKFGIDDGDDQIFIPSGFPIGKVQSLDHLKEIKNKYNKGDVFYNIITGKTFKAGNATMYYGEGWCVKRNTPAYEAIRRVEREEDNDDESTQVVEIEEREGWEVLKSTRYIWSRTLGKIVGRLDKNNNPNPLTQKYIEAIKQSKIPWERVSEDKLDTFKLPFTVPKEK